MNEQVINRTIEQSKNVIADRVKDRLEDGTLVFNLRNTVLNHIRVNQFPQTRLVIYMSPDYSQQVIWVDRFTSAADKIYEAINESTLEKGIPVQEVRIAMLGVDENKHQIPGSEREWTYQLK